MPGGWLAARTSLRFTLVLGLGLQVVALGLLALLDRDWSHAASVAYVMACQSLSSIAKDLTKMSAKSAVNAVFLAVVPSALQVGIGQATLKPAFKDALSESTDWR